MRSPLSSCYRSGTSLENLGARGAVASGLATAGLAGWQVIVPVRVPFSYPGVLTKFEHHRTFVGPLAGRWAFSRLAACSI